ncbi:MAG: carboxypeptidase-like regulatory domain-containing protein, partial [Bryobacteraceae bacterium]
MRGRTWITAVGILSFLPLLEAQNPAAFALAGVMVRAGTNQPLKHVLVTVTYVPRRQWHLSYITDSDGRFIFANLPAGKWNLSAEKDGYPPTSYQSDEGYSTAVVLGAGADSTHIVFPLTPAAILSGTVVDEHGDPVWQAQVMIFRTGVVSGKLTTGAAGASQTDGSGEFTFGALPPGKYYVAVSGRPWYANNFDGNVPFMINAPGGVSAPSASESTQHDDRDVAYPITYYGDATDASAAEPVTIREGDEARIHITLRAAPSWRIIIPGGQGRGISVEAIGPANYPVNFPAPMASISGAIEVHGIPSGHYEIKLMGPHGNLQKIVDVDGDQTINFADAVSPIKVMGHVKWEGLAPLAANPQSILSLVGDDPGIAANAQIATDGSFQFEGTNSLTPGRYRVMLQNSAGFAVSSVQATGAKYANGVVDLAGEGPVDLSIVATSNLTKLNGLATKNGVPCPAAMILLLPADGNPDLIRRDQSDSDGTFTLPDV